MIRFFIDRRRLVLLSTLWLALMPLPATGQTEQADATDAAKPARWFRHVFNVSATSKSDALVGVVDPAVCRIWVNGQRLRPDAGRDSIAGFRVTELLRKGANCLAVESQTTGNALPIAVSIGASPPKTIACRMKTTQPPVGWQKTDFNDRDWKALECQLAKVDWDTVPMNALQPKSTTSRIQAGRFRFHDRDHVVLLGGTFIERAQQFGHLEAALMTSGAKNLTFRNLGWSADTVFAESRGIFDSPAKGYARMIEHLRAEEPDVVLVQYGQNEAMQGQSAADIEKFQQQLRQLISDIKVTTAEVVLVTPHPLLPAPPPLPDATLWNDRIGSYCEAIAAVAAQSSCPCVDLFEDFDHRLLAAAESVGFWRAGLVAAEHPDLKTALISSLTDNGMHWNNRGYRCVSSIVADSLFAIKSNGITVGIEDRESSRSVAVSMPGEISVASNAIQVKLNRPWLRPQLLVVDTTKTVASMASCQLNSQTGSQPLVQMSSGEATQLSRFQVDQDYERLVEQLVRKNELYFHRWRPQNITYLFGFRKHEQGNNASEIAEFDPLIVECEQQIQALVNSAGPTIRLELE